MRRPSFAVFLGGVLLAAGALCFPAWSAPGPEWAAIPGANPAAVAWLDPKEAGQASLTAALFANSSEASYSAGYAVPDTGRGAASLVLTYSRTWVSGATDEARSYAYSWARRWRPRLAAGATVRLERRQYWVDALGATAPRSGPGLDLGAIWLADDRTWVGVALQDVFDTVLPSDGGHSDVLPMSLQLSAGRRVSPQLSLSLEGRDVTANTQAGPSWRAEVAFRRGNLTYRAAALAGAVYGWSTGVTARW
ncbi:MAG: hypothetical protein ACM3XZ_08635 [Betaproteobacteria bacterium]